MSKHAIQCLIIQKNGNEQKNLEAALRDSHFKPRYQSVTNSADLQRRLGHLPALLFCPDSMNDLQRQKLHEALYKLAPDCIAVYYAEHKWSALSLTSGGVATCTLTTGQPAELNRQLDYLLAYATQRAEFRHCKHLLNIVEQRNQWLVECSREAVAYITRDQHLYANATYLHLFGFESERGALNVPVSQLVSSAHHKAFLSLSRKTELKAFLPNKFLLHMCSSKRADGFFRAEVRFMPAVFRGQRCIQLHVHPLLDTVVNREKDNSQVVLDPWEVRVPVVSKRVVEGELPGISRGVGGAAKPANRNALKVDFQELLNLKGSQNPALLIVRPYMKKSGEKISGKSLLSRLGDEARTKVDEQCLKAAARYLYKRLDHPLKNGVWVELGEWVLNDKQGLERLLNFLNENKKITPTLVISIEMDSCIKLNKSAVRILPLLHSTGVRIALDSVRQLTPEVSAALEVSKIVVVRTHPDLLKQVKASGEFNEELAQILQLRNVSVVIDGVSDVDTMNLLCDSNAAYLQGEVLDKFPR